MTSSSPLGSPNAKQDFFKTALNEETQIDSLLTYYRQKISNFENERFEWISRFQQLKLSKEEQHRGEWDLKRAKDEIADLQRALSDARLKLFEEKQLKLKYQNENEQLNDRVFDDRKKIGELMNICKPVEQKVVFRKNKKPSIMTKFVNNDLNIDFHKQNGRRGKSKPRGERMLTTANSKSSKGLYKTVILTSDPSKSQAYGSPRSQITDLEASNLSNNGQGSLVLQEHVNSLREELNKRERDLANQRQEMNSSIEELMRKKEDLEKLNVTLNKDFFAQRIKFEQIERKLQQENELLRLKNVSLANQLAETQQKTEIETKVSKDLMEKKSMEFTQGYKQKYRRKEDELAHVKDQYNKVQVVYVDKIKTLEDNLKRFKTKFENLKKKKNLEISGYKAEIRNLRTQFKILLRDIEIENKDMYYDVLNQPVPDYPRKKTRGKKKGRKGKNSKRKITGRQEYYDDETIDIEDLGDLKSKMQEINQKLSQQN